MAIFKFGTTEPSLLHWQPWLSVCLLLGWGQTYADLVLIEDGQPRSTVVVGSQRSEKEHLAATELQNYLTKITGAKVPRARDTNLVAGPRILVGRSAASDTLSLEVAELGRDGHLIQAVGSDLVLRGKTDQGTLNAVYAFLENHLDVRWFMPGQLGEDIIPRSTVRLPNDLRETRTPDFMALYGLKWSGHSPGAPAWERRNRAWLGPPRYFFEHSFHFIILETDKEREAHPDWFARDIHGKHKRSGQLCTTNPEVVRVTIEKALEYFAQRPEAATFGLAPEDGHGSSFCECDRCLALDAELGITDGPITDRLMVFCNQVAQGLRQNDPEKYREKYLGFLAYQNYTTPPQKVVPDDMVLVVITHMHWDFCDTHPLEHPDCRPNAQFLEWLEGWLAASKHVGVYDYFGHNEFYVPWPLWNTSIPQHIRTYERLGVEFLIVESQQNWANQGMNFYATAKLAWSVDRDMEALWTDFYARFYGPAEEPMRRYWTRWERAMVESNGHQWDWIKGYTPTVIEECRGYLEEAWRSVEQAEGSQDYDATRLEKVRGRLRLAEEGFKHTDMWYQMRRAKEAKQWATAIGLAEEVIAHIESTRGSKPQVFIEWLALRHIFEQEMAILKKRMQAER